MCFAFYKTLYDQFLEWLSDAVISMSSGFGGVGDVVVVADELVPETSVKEMHYGVFHTADVDVNGHAAEDFGVKRSIFVLGIKIS